MSSRSTNRRYGVQRVSPVREPTLEKIVNNGPARSENKVAVGLLDLAR